MSHPPRCRAAAGRGLVRKLLPVVIVVAVVAAECLVAYFYLPTASQTEALAHAVVHGPGPAKPAAEEKHDPKHGEEKKEPKPDLVEVDLGEFTVTAFQPGSNSTLRIALHLYGTVAGRGPGRFNARMKETQHRFRE